MKVGTKSVLFGAHAFWYHGWFVALAWWKLYGFPTQVWLWIAFFIHDIGYVGKPNMDGDEGEQHPWTGARIMWWLQGAWIFLHQPVFFQRLNFSVPLRWWHVRRRWADGMLGVSQQKVIWGNECFFHSRFFSRKYNAEPSRLCWADKLSLSLEPRWFYYIRVKLTGEIREYRSQQNNGHRDGMVDGTDWQWVTKMQEYSRQVVQEKRHAPAPKGT